MTIAALVLLFAIPQSGPVPQNADAPKISQSVAAVSTDAQPKPAAPAVDDSAVSASVTAAKDSPTLAASALPAMPEPKPAAAAPEAVPAGFPIAPVKSPAKVYSETPTQRRVWYTLAIAGHSAAAFDAWSTRRAISGGYGTEANPLLRPFAHSGALYVATQVSPAFMDFLGKRMMTSRYGMFRKLWWLPQAAGAGVSFAAGAHNVGLTQ